MLTMSGYEVQTYLQRAFLELNSYEIGLLAQAATPQKYEASHVIIKEGDEGHTLYVLVDGEVDIFVNADDKPILIDTIGPGSYFGEMAFLGETTRMATIRTRTACQTLEINEQDFMPIAQRNPQLLQNLLRQIIGHLRRNDSMVIQELNNKNRALQKAYREMEEQEQLRTQFIATLSHELRTPLTSIQGFLSLINQNAVTGDSLNVAMQSITRNVERLVGLTNDMLILYEMHPAQLTYTYVDVADVVIEALNGARAGLEGRETAVSLDIAKDMPRIRVDRRGIVLALRAIIENAFKFSPQNTPVTISSFMNEPGEVVIQVKDEGIGMATEQASRIFDPFVRLEQEGSELLFPGLGVGLTIARFMVEKHQGRLEVDTLPGKGSTFTIVLPQPEIGADAALQDEHA